MANTPNKQCLASCPQGWSIQPTWWQGMVTMKVYCGRWVHVYTHVLMHAAVLFLTGVELTDQAKLSAQQPQDPPVFWQLAAMPCHHFTVSSGYRTQVLTQIQPALYGLSHLPNPFLIHCLYSGQIYRSLIISSKIMLRGVYSFFFFEELALFSEVPLYKHLFAR